MLQVPSISARSLLSGAALALCTACAAAGNAEEGEPTTQSTTARAEALAAETQPGSGFATPEHASVLPEPEKPTGLPGCVETTADLPDSSVLDRTDERLQGDDVIVVLKKNRRILLMSGGQVHRGERPGGLPSCWRSALAYDYPPGHKQRQGDLKTPEGWYRTSDKPTSQYYGAIAIHYPGVADAERGLKAGMISKNQRDGIVAALERDAKPNQRTRLGGEILIHGQGSSSDWTLGCVALENGDIDELREALPDGKRTNILVLP